MTGRSLSSVPLSGEVAKGLIDTFGPQVLSSAPLAPALLPRQHRTLPTPTAARIGDQLPAELPAEIAPRSKHTTLDQCGHNVHLEQPAVVHALLRNRPQAPCG